MRRHRHRHTSTTPPKIVAHILTNRLSQRKTALHLYIEKFEPASSSEFPRQDQDGPILHVNESAPSATGAASKFRSQCQLQFQKSSKTIENTLANKVKAKLEKSAKGITRPAHAHAHATGRGSRRPRYGIELDVSDLEVFLFS
jgi:hypothetical protein